MKFVTASDTERYREEMSKIDLPFESVVLPKISYLSGLDFLKVSLWLDWKDPEFKTLLKEFKEEFNDEHLNKNPDAKERSLELANGMSFNVMPHGAGPYSYVLRSGDITLLFSNHKPDAQFPNCRIEIGSMSCWHPGWLKLFGDITDWLRSHGADIERQAVTEFHLTVDMLGIDYNTAGFANVNRWTARANRYGVNGEHYVANYLSLGKGDSMLRCYNKTGELRSDSAKHDFFHDIWREHTGEDVEHVTRIEFQVRRSVIKKLGIKSVYDLSTKLNSVWLYFVGDTGTSGWCRFLDREMTESDRKHKNHQRYATDILWARLRTVRFNKGRTFKMVRTKTQHINVEQLMKQMAGCGASLCGAVGLAEEDHVGHMCFVSDMIKQQMRKNYKKDPNEYQRKIKTKHNAAEITF